MDLYFTHVAPVDYERRCEINGSSCAMLEIGTIERPVIPQRLILPRIV